MRYDEILNKKVKRLAVIREMRSWVEGLHTSAHLVAIFHWVPICHKLMSVLQTFIQTCLARETSLSFVLIYQTAFLQVVVMYILCIEHKFKV
jgi:hypothetical protein